MCDFTLPNMTYNRSQILAGITAAMEAGDLSFIETVNNISWGYKVELKQNITKHNNDTNRR